MAKGANQRLIERIEERLAAVQLTARGASMAAGLHENAIRTIKRGHAPKASTLVALAAALQCTPAYLLEAADVLAKTAGSVDHQVLSEILAEIIRQMQDKGYELVPSAIANATAVVYEDVLEHRDTRESHRLPQAVGIAIRYERRAKDGEHSK